MNYGSASVGLIELKTDSRESDKVLFSKTLLVVIVLRTAADKCFLATSAGSCRAALTRYFYNSSANECQRFIYGGCDGNANNFESMKLCEEECERPLSPG